MDRGSVFCVEGIWRFSLSFLLMEGFPFDLIQRSLMGGSVLFFSYMHE